MTGKPRGKKLGPNQRKVQAYQRKMQRARIAARKKRKK